MRQTPRYSFERVDTATRVRREELIALAPGWGGIDTTRPQFAIFDGKDLADWPLVESFEQAVKDCRDFNALCKSDDGAASEAAWQRRMGGDLEAWA